MEILVASFHIRKQGQADSYQSWQLLWVQYCYQLHKLYICCTEIPFFRDKVESELLKKHVNNAVVEILSVDMVHRKRSEDFFLSIEHLRGRSKLFAK